MPGDIPLYKWVYNIYITTETTVAITASSPSTSVPPLSKQCRLSRQLRSWKHWAGALQTFPQPASLKPKRHVKRLLHQNMVPNINFWSNNHGDLANHVFHHFSTLRMVIWLQNKAKNQPILGEMATVSRVLLSACGGNSVLWPQNRGLILDPKMGPQY